MAGTRKSSEPPRSPKGLGPPGAGLNWFLIIGLVLLMVFLLQSLGTSRYQEIDYSEARAHLEAGQIERVEVSPTLMVLHPSEEAVDDEGEPLPTLRAIRVQDDAGLVELLETVGVAYRGFQDPSCGGGMLGFFLLPLLLLMVFWFFMLRRIGPGAQAMNFGKMKAKLYAEEDIKVRFADVAGVDEAKEELQEVVDFLRNPERFRKLGARIPRGVMLVGPPGTGKTLLGRAVAGEAGVTFFSLSGSDFVEMFVGVGAARVRDLFEQAKERAPCIIFLDELDAIGKARGGPGSPVGGNDEREQTLNALLVEMDGFDERDGVIVLAATNRPETLDPALLRPGRFDRQVLVDRPDRAGRRAILAIHVARIVAGPDVDLDEIAQQTTGFAGADLANVVNEAALLAARRHADAVEMVDFSEAIERVIAGLEKKNRRMMPSEKEVVAYHENGHAIVAHALPTSDPVRRVSIVPRGMGALGYTLQVPLEDRFLMTERQLFDRICGLLGGRAAEAVVFGEVSTGAQNDLQRVTDLARRMMTEFGMSQRIGLVHLARAQRPLFLESGAAGGGGYSEATAEMLDAEIREVVERAFAHTVAVLQHNRDLLSAMSLELLRTEMLDGPALEHFLDQVQPLPEDTHWAAERARAAGDRETARLVEEEARRAAQAAPGEPLPPPGPMRLSEPPERTTES